MGAMASQVLTGWATNSKFYATLENVSNLVGKKNLTSKKLEISLIKEPHVEIDETVRLTILCLI